MCGIAGFIGQSTIPEQTRVERCLAHLRKRGPDMQGLAVILPERQIKITKEWTPVAGTSAAVLLHTRLSILDLSESGRQPMKDARGNVIVFNGEIYNYLEIRNELKAYGFEFVTGTDTEVILAAYAKWGEWCVERFNGMWAFALYDATKDVLFISRDRMGVKPVYYSRPTPASFAFASDIPALHALMGQTPTICGEHLAAVFKYGVTDDATATMFKGIRELRGGHNGYLDLKSGAWSTVKYWDLPEEEDFVLSEDAALEKFTHLFEDAVRLRFRADVPIALTCSGGVDSTAMAIATVKLGKDVTLYTAHLPEDAPLDESKYARRTAEALKLRHVLVRPDEGAWKDQVTDLSQAQAMPYGSLSLYLHWSLLKEIRARGMPIVLSGQGADEVFFGYERYYASFIAAQSPNLVKIVQTFRMMREQSTRNVSNLLTFLTYFGLPHLQLLRRSHRARAALRASLLNLSTRSQSRFTTDRRALQRMELRDFNLPRLLRYDDRTAGALGMETRLPFLDYRLVEFAYRLPWQHCFNRGWTKYVVRRYIENNGIRDLAWRKGKLGFEAPTDRWLIELAADRWAQYQDSSFAKRILRDGSDFATWSPEVRWGVYNVLELASLFDWKLE